MRIPRIYTHHPLRTGRELSLDRESARHLVQVLRMRPGTTLTLFNGDGRNYQGLLLECTRNSALVTITGSSHEERLPALKINLGLGLSRGERMDFAIQKSVELGVSSITPLTTEHAMVKISAERMENRQQHWKRVVIAACEQSGRCRLPDLCDTCSLDQWLLSGKAFSGIGILLDHRSETTLERLTCTDATVNLLIGPEGGLSDGERSQAQTAGFESVRLGPRVMRTETAPLAAISAIQMLWGDFRENPGQDSGSCAGKADYH